MLYLIYCEGGEMKFQELTVKDMIQELRNKGVRREEIAYKVGISYRTLCRWISGDVANPVYKNKADLVKLVEEYK